MQRTDSILKQALAWVHLEDYQAAYDYLQPYCDIHCREASLLHLFGISLESLQRFFEAEEVYKQALRAAPKERQYQLRLAAVKLARTDFNGAVTLYKQLHITDPQCPETLYGYCVCTLELLQNETALALAQQGQQFWPGAPVFYLLAGRACVLKGDDGQAYTFFQEGLTRDPSDVECLYELAVSGMRLGLDAEVNDYLHAAEEQAVDTHQAWFSLAHVYYQLGRGPAALHAFRKALSYEPGHSETYELVRRLCHEFGFEGPQAIHIDDLSHSQLRPYEFQQIMADVSQDLQTKPIIAVRKKLDDLEAYVGSNAEISRSRAKCFARDGDFQQAVYWAENALVQAPNHVSSILDLCEYHLSGGQLEQADAVLKAYMNDECDDQRYWALKGTIWQLTGHEQKVKWLYGFDSLVSEIQLPRPVGFTNLQSFLDLLQARVMALHVTCDEPLSQSLRGGTQTLGHLLDNPDPVIKTFKYALRQCVAAYVESLPHDPAHPFLRRKRACFDFSGSWSVHLQGGGHHVSHIHPEGWISSAFYVAVDSCALGASDVSPDGWLHFGVPGFPVPDNKVAPSRLIKPKPGHLVLFPSYVWHGTCPMQQNGTRLTAPFDICPV